MAPSVYQTYSYLHITPFFRTLLNLELRAPWRAVFIFGVHEWLLADSSHCLGQCYLLQIAKVLNGFVTPKSQRARLLILTFLEGKTCFFLSFQFPFPAWLRALGRELYTWITACMDGQSSVFAPNSHTQATQPAMLSLLTNHNWTSSFSYFGACRSSVSLSCRWQVKFEVISCR